MSIEIPNDLAEGTNYVARQLRACKAESPCWGYEGEGEQCLRVPGHDGPHFYKDAQVIVQWEGEQ